MSSLRELPQQFGKGLTLDATRIEQNVLALEALREVPPRHVERRFFPSWLSWGYMSDTKLLADTPLQLPWLREKNTDLSATYSPIPVVTNLYRHKSVYTPGVTYVDNSDNLYVWEVAFETLKPTYLTNIYAFMATDSTYVNDGTYGAPAPPTKTNLQALDDLVLQVFVDDIHDPELRARTSVEAGSFNQLFSTSMQVAGLVLGGMDTMLPAHPQGAAKGYRFLCDCDVLLPPGRIRIALSIPSYSTYTTEWGTAAYPWQTAVWSIGAKISEGTHEQ